MMYDHFDQVLDRRATNTLKWNVGEGELPMWVADMDFETAPEIHEAIMKRAAHGAFGYADLTEEWYEAYQSWWLKRHHFRLEKEWLVYCTGVIPALSSMVRKLTTPAENVVILTPVYQIFYNSILNNGRNVLECELNYDGINYEIDFERLEEALANPQTSMMIFCNPHNPVGKIWDLETLRRVGELCIRYRVILVSDEIHCDLTEPGEEYIPFASVSPSIADICITCIAPTKTFNLAGLQTAAVVVKDPVLRHRVWRGINTDEVGEPNAFAVEAAVAAFTKGAHWLDALREYLHENRLLVKRLVEETMPELSLVPSKATYLLWLDAGSLLRPENEENAIEKRENSKDLADFIRRETGLYLSDGVQYGKGGENFLRLNIACSRSVLEEGLSRLQKGVDLYRKSKKG